MKAIQTFRHKTENKIFEIFQDQSSDNPRTWDTLGTIYATHSRYNFADRNANEHDLERAKKDGVVLNLYLYDHSGLKLSTQPFADPWDSMQIGYVYVTKEKIEKEYNVKRITKKLRQQVENVLQSEIKTYNDYVSGNVYGFVVSEIKKCSLDVEHKTHIDSCWGFFGTDMDQNGMWDHIGNKEDWLEA
jgi:hypothetical protein